jgi:hypothetical protein
MKQIKYNKILDGEISRVRVLPNKTILVLSQVLIYEQSKYCNEAKNMIIIPTWSIDFYLTTQSQDEYTKWLFEKDGYYIVNYRDDEFPSKCLDKQNNIILGCFGIAYCPEQFYID